MKRMIRLCFLLLCGYMNSEAQTADTARHIHIVFIGNSITYGAGLGKPAHESAPARAALYLSKQPGVAAVKFANRGVSGATTTDFLPEEGTLFKEVCRAADRLKEETWATLLFSLSLGTNDSAVEGTNGSPVSPSQYRRQMTAIIDRLLTLYPSSRVVVHRPLWYSSNTCNGAVYLEEGLARLQTYYPQLQQLVAEYQRRWPGRVFMGDTDAYDRLKGDYIKYYQPEQGRAGIFYLHPNAEGASLLGTYWGKALMRVVAGEGNE